MSDVMLHGVLNMPLPDDPAEMDLVTWAQFRDRAKEASDRILADADRIKALNARLRKAGDRLSFCAQTSGGSAGRDDDLVEAINGWAAARAALEEKNDDE